MTPSTEGFLTLPGGSGEGFPNMLGQRLGSLQEGGQGLQMLRGRWVHATELQRSAKSLSFVPYVIRVH